MRKILFLFVVLLLVGCKNDPITTDDLIEASEEMGEFVDTVEEKVEEAAIKIEEKIEELKPCDGWRGAKLKDVKTGETFKVCDFKGKPILIESFAVWCPTCKRQQDQIKQLHEVIGDSAVSISLDTDPNEDESKVLGHQEAHGYDWYFAVSPVEVTQDLIDEFGVSVVNAPGAPVVLVCEDMSARLLDRGVKSKEKIQEEIEKGC